MLSLTNAVINNILNNMLHIIGLYFITIYPRYSKQKTWLLCTAAGVACQGVSVLSFYLYQAHAQSFLFMFFICNILYMSVYLFALQGGVKRTACFIYFSYICVWATVYVVSLVLTRNVFRNFEPMVWILRTVLGIVSIAVYNIYLRQPLIKNRVSMDKASVVLVIVSGMACVLVPMLIILYAFNEQTAWGIGVIVFMLVFSFMVYVLIFRLIKQLGKEGDMRTIEAQNKYLADTVDNFRTLESEMQRLRHDQKHHNLMILEYAKKGDTEAIIDYLSHSYEREQEIAERLSANTTIDNILRAYKRKAAKCGIDISFDVRLTRETAVVDVDLVTMLGNILENALHGTTQADGNKWIKMSIVHQGIKLVVKCKNTCISDIEFENGMPKRKKGYGIGAYSIAETAKRYDGDVIFEAEDNIFMCCAILNDKR